MMKGQVHSYLLCMAHLLDVLIRNIIDLSWVHWVFQVTLTRRPKWQ